MTRPSRYRGRPVSEGVAAGRLYRRDIQAGGHPATPDEVAQMADLLRLGMRAGGFGFSTDRNLADTDYDGSPLPTFGGRCTIFIRSRGACGPPLEFVTVYRKT